MIHSMTGFGRAAGALSPRFHVAITAKSVNHRFLETSVRLPEYLCELESLVRAMRAREGESLRADIGARLQTIRELQEHVSALRDDMRHVLLVTLRERVNEVAKVGGVAGPEERIAQEVLMMVELADIAEEIT